MGVESSGYLGLDAVERSTTDEEDVLCVHLCVVLVRVLASALGGYVDHRAFEELEESLLHALAADVARDAGVVRLAGYLVDLVDEDDTALRLGPHRSRPPAGVARGCSPRPRRHSPGLG